MIEANGFVHVQEFVLPGTLQQFIDEFDRCIRDAVSLGLAVDDKPIGATEIYKVAEASTVSPLLVSLIESLLPRVAATMRWPAAYRWTDSLYAKPPNSGSRSVLAFHQDLHYWEGLLASDEAVTAVVPLYRARRESGGVGFVPGSHHLGLHPKVDPAWNEVYPAVEPGHCTLHLPLTLHGSRENSTGEHRRSISLHLTRRADLARR